MRLVAIDYGERNIGVAVGDTEVGVATPKTVIQNSGKKAVREAIAAILEEIGAERIVVGLPLSFRMEETAASEKVRAFGRWMRREFKLPVDFENEILSSAHASRLRPGAPKRISHAIAAALILQNWLDRRTSRP